MRGAATMGALARGVMAYGAGVLPVEAWPLGDPLAGGVALVLAGMLAGVANTLAGGGSFVILPILRTISAMRSASR